MHRHALTDEQWDRLQAVLPRDLPGRRSLLGDRLFIEAVMYRAKTGIPWRDLPERFGPWKTVYNRFANWSRRGVWAQIFKALQKRVDKRSCIIDGTVVRAHQDASGGKGGSNGTLWVVHVEDSQRRSTSSSMRRHVRSMLRSRRVSVTR